MAPKTPRFDPYQKLFYRLYEVILLLRNLNKSQGPHLVRNHDASDMVATRRRFLNNLAFLCDYKKGGDTTAAIAVEDTEEHYKFWIAMNRAQNGETDVVFFVRAVLTLLKQAAQLPIGEAEAHEATVLRLSLKHASKRLKKEFKLLSTAVTRCITLLEDSGGSSELELASWLEGFQYRNDFTFHDLCILAFDQRHSPEAYQLERLSIPGETTAGPFTQSKPFKDAHHYLGRLANHVRVVNQLLEDSRQLQDLLDSFHVGLISVPEAVPLPPYDGHITLESILGRMLHNDDPRRQQMAEIMSTLRRIGPAPGIEANIIETFKEPDITPQVHAEVQLLEFFSPVGGGGVRRKFAFGDRFIGCSKFSCFCCKLYFQHHPSRPVQRESHENHWPQWSPPRLPNGSRDVAFKAQRMLMQKVIKEIGEVALDRIDGLIQTSSNHPDSITDITGSVREG